MFESTRSHSAVIFVFITMFGKMMSKGFMQNIDQY
jgi:H+/gluconate symporter-like permease